MATDVQPPLSERLRDLIGQIRAIAGAGSDGAAIGASIARALRPHLGARDLLLPEHCVPDPVKYRQHVLHVEPGGRFSVVSLVWLPGQATPIHDHVSWCVVGVHQGHEFEARYALREVDGTAYLVAAGHSVNETRSATALTPPGDIHRVENRGPGVAISLHIYGADIARLGSSIRRCYDLPIRRAAAPPEPGNGIAPLGGSFTSVPRRKAR